jgi:hypothetical protein
MNKAARTALVTIALLLSGGLLAMNLTPNASVKISTVSPTWNPVSSAGFDLGVNVDWSRVKQEPQPPTF